MREFDSIIIGGGFYGCSIANHFRRRGDRVLLLEQSNSLLSRASFNNQARVHNGYHYPRSLLTALRSRANLPVFVDKYKPAISSNFVKLYAVPRLLSKVSASQFFQFCQHIGAPVKAASNQFERLFNRQLIDEVFEVEEYVFDANRLRELLQEELETSGVELIVGAKATEVTGATDRVFVETSQGDIFSSTRVFNCTYSAINDFGGVDQLPLKNEITELGMIEVHPELKRVGITVMCGPFFSCMPFPARSLHSLSHVRYTPHGEWHKRAAEFGPKTTESLRSNYPLMVADAARYVPLLKESIYRDSIWEIKTVLKANEIDDGRPVLVQMNHGLRHFHSVLGGKIDNVFDCIDELEKRREEL